MTSVEIRIYIYITVSCTGSIKGTIIVYIVPVAFIDCSIHNLHIRTCLHISIYIATHHHSLTLGISVIIPIQYIYLLWGCMHCEGRFMTELNIMLQYAPLL